MTIEAMVRPRKASSDSNRVAAGTAAAGLCVMAQRLAYPRAHAQSPLPSSPRPSLDDIRPLRGGGRSPRRAAGGDGSRRAPGREGRLPARGPRRTRSARPDDPPRHPLCHAEQPHRPTGLPAGTRIPAAARGRGARPREPCAGERGIRPRRLRRLPPVGDHQDLLGRDAGRQEEVRRGSRPSDRSTTAAAPSTSRSTISRPAAKWRCRASSTR